METRIQLLVLLTEANSGLRALPAPESTAGQALLAATLWEGFSTAAAARESAFWDKHQAEPIIAPAYWARSLVPPALGCSELLLMALASRMVSGAEAIVQAASAAFLRTMSSEHRLAWNCRGRMAPSIQAASYIANTPHRRAARPFQLPMEAFRRSAESTAALGTSQ